LNSIARRRTFAIISHPDAGKTTLTEKLLLFGGADPAGWAKSGRRAASGGRRGKLAAAESRRHEPTLGQLVRRQPR
jgi:hypothetical protein